MKYALFASGLSALLISHADADERGDKLFGSFDLSIQAGGLQL